MESGDSGDSASKGCIRLSEWHTLVVGLQGALVTGFIYAYSTYSNALQKQFDLSESSKETIGLGPPISNLVTFTTGIIMDKTSVGFCCIMGGLIAATVYTLYGLIALKYIPFEGDPTYLFFFFAGCGNYAGSFMVAGVFSTLPKNFRESRSSVVSIAKSWVGVASGVGSAIYVGLFPGPEDAPERLNFLFFLAAVAGSIPILISPILKPVTGDMPKPLRDFVMPSFMRLPFGYIISAVLISVTLVSAFFEQNAIFSVVLLVLLGLPFILILPGAKLDVRGHEASLVEGDGGGIAQIPQEQSPKSPWEGGPCDLVRRAEFYMLWICAFAIQSGGIFLTTNLGSMVQSRSGEAVAAATATTVFSCFQGTSRLFTGVVSNQMVASGIPRTWCFVVLTLIMAAGHAVICLEGPAPLLVGTALGGIAFGSVFPLLVLTVSEVFGQARLASNYMIFDGSPGAVGSIVFAKVLAGAVYRSHQHCDVNGQHCECDGDECFRLSHLVIIGVELAVGLVGVFLGMRSRAVYKMLRGDEPPASQDE